jgi:hypothetical protein
VSGYGWRRSEADDFGDPQLGEDDIGKHPAVITVDPVGWRGNPDVQLTCISAGSGRYLTGTHGPQQHGRAARPR